MRYRWIAALTAALALAFTVATAAAQAATTNTLTVWLQVDAQNGWPGVVAAANTAFECQPSGLDRQRRLSAMERPPGEVRRNDRR